MNLSATAEHLDNGGDGESLMGLATLMTMAYSGIDLAPLGVKMIERATRNPEDANARMDLATIMHLDFAPDLALDIQAQALRIRQLYHLPAAAGTAGIRLLAIMAPGTLMANAPLEFLVEGSDVALDMLYISADLPVPETLPEHDLMFVAINERDEVHPLLAQLATLAKDWPRPVLNAPERIALLSRDGTCSLLKSAPGIVMPSSVRVDRQTLEKVSRKELAIAALLADGDFPALVRPVGSHAGQGLAKLDDRSAVENYLQGRADDAFYITRFVDYRGADGMFHKYRIVLIDGRPYACHMAISRHWMVHYLNAGMERSAAKRAEEARFMTGFDEGFARRHQDALRAIHARVGLDYLVIDCAETPAGDLLVFEIDSGAVVHAMDPVDVFPYKQAQMRKVFRAFREMLAKAAERGLSR